MKLKKEYEQPIRALCDLLEAEGIPHEIQKLYDGFQVFVPMKGRKKTCDVVIHSNSYGHEEGLFEFWETNSGKDVVGFLTPEAACKTIKAWWAQR